MQKNETFNWSEEPEKAFTKLKEALCTAPLLESPDMSKPFSKTTDTSGYAVGGILSQGKIGSDLPVANTSRVLRGPELKYDTYEKQALAVIHAVRAFRPYVFGITIVTDHQPLIWFKTADINTRVQKWRFKLSEYDYEIIYKPGKMNANADALSRNPVEYRQINVITRRQALMKSNLKETNAQVEEPKSKRVIPTRIQARTTKRNQNKVINYAESDIESDYEAEARLPEKKKVLKNYQTSPTNDEPSQNRTILKGLDIDVKNTGSELSSTDAEVNQNAISRREVTDKEIGKPQELRKRSTSGSNHQSETEISIQTPYSRNLVETKELLQFRKDNIVYIVASDGSPCDEGSRGLIEANKIPRKQTLQIGSISESNWSNGKYIFG